MVIIIKVQVSHMPSSNNRELMFLNVSVCVVKLLNLWIWYHRLHAQNDGNQCIVYCLCTMFWLGIRHQQHNHALRLELFTSYSFVKEEIFNTMVEGCYCDGNMDEYIYVIRYIIVNGYGWIPFPDYQSQQRNNFRECFYTLDVNLKI